MRHRDFEVLLRNFSDILKVKVKVALDRESVRVNHSNESTLIESYFSITQILLSVSN